ncbi:hypothetical protein D3C81_667170 [compost metagenome]
MAVSVTVSPTVYCGLSAVSVECSTDGAVEINVTLQLKAPTVVPLYSGNIVYVPGKVPFKVVIYVPFCSLSVIVL